MLLVRPTTVTGELAAVAVMAPGLHVAVYPVIALPPFEAGAVKVMTACVLPGDADPMVGAPGGTIGAGVTVAVPEAGLEPVTLRAVTEQVYRVPFTRPVTFSGEVVPVAVPPAPPVHVAV